MTQKEELLSQMYTLRAGLSWLSQKKVELDKLNNAVKVPAKITEKEILEKTRQRVKSLENQLKDTEKKELDVCGRQIKDKGVDKVAAVTIFFGIIAFSIAVGLFAWGYDLMLNPVGLRIVGMWVAFIIAGIFSIGGLLLLSLIISLTSNPKSIKSQLAVSIMFYILAAALEVGGGLLLKIHIFWSGISFALGGIALIIAVVETILYSRNRRRDKKFYKEWKVFYDKEKELKKAIEAAKQDVENARKDLVPKVQAQNEADIAEAHRKIEDIRKNQIEPLTKLCNDFYDTLLENYGNSLDKRDWAYLDLVIFYIETNRAESIREALQQIDRERQTQQIVASMREATEQICLSIKTEMRSLGQSIEYGFNRLESSVSDMKNIFNRRISSLQASVENSAAQTQLLASAQISQSTLTNALLAKSNATSEQLMNDVNYIRQRLY